MDVMDFIKWSIAIFIPLLEITIIVLIWRGQIDLRFLISEDNGMASLSRFQFLIFTFVIVGIFAMMSFDAMDMGKWVDIPGAVLGLMGISGGSYVAAKGIQESAKQEDTKVAAAKPEDRWVRN